MSTRATYRFIGEYQDVTFYIHHDGYPEYAWNYFQNAISFEGSGTLADSFHRANDRSEITQSHETHGDTEFQYTVTFKNYGEDASIKAVKVDLGGGNPKNIF